MDLAEKINDHLDAGKTVTIATRAVSTTIAPKDRAAWRAAGHEYFRTDKDGATLMIGRVARGKPRYDCIAYRGPDGKTCPMVSIRLN